MIKRSLISDMASQILVLLQELRNENRVYYRGNTSATKWFAGPSAAKDS